MYISKISLQNFKGFKGHHVINLDAGVNFFVGNNNCGKSTIFEAVDFIRTRKTRDEVITKTEIDNNSDVSVEIELRGDDLDELIKTDALKKYAHYVISKDGAKSLRIMRSSEESKITQNKKDKVLTINNVRVYNSDKGQFENPAGIDSTIAALFDAQFVWADTNSDDVADFSKTKICGKIINTIVSDRISDTWNSFKKSHKETFEKITKNLEPVEKQIEEKISQQYGDTEIKFSFTLPEINDFLKSGHIDLSDSGIQTASSEKGTGMQRALALSLIQVYADITANGQGDALKPIMFFLDEPETFLHPQAQDRLLDSLEKISKQSQVFVVTHSPYLLRKYKKVTHSLSIFSKEGSFNKIKEGAAFTLFGSSSPTWGEINYYAFGVISVEFHNELYGFIQAKAILENEDYYKPKNFDNYLLNKGIQKNQRYVHLKADNSTTTYDTTLPTKIRNTIHHPENTHNGFSKSDLRSSIESLIPLI